MAISKISTGLNQTLAPVAVKDDNVPRDGRHQEVLKASRLYESQFLREMVREMRKTVPESEFMPSSNAEKIFRDQLDDQNVDSWVDRGGVGFADLIYDQMMERYFNNQQIERPQGPVLLDQKAFQAQAIKLTPNDTTYKIQRTALGGPVPAGGSDVTAPWAGKVLMAKPFEHGMQSLLLDHGNGLKSSLVYKGSLLIPEGSTVEAGQRVGLLSSENPSVLWRIQK